MYTSTHVYNDQQERDVHDLVTSLVSSKKNLEGLQEKYLCEAKDILRILGLSFYNNYFAKPMGCGIPIKTTLLISCCYKDPGLNSIEYIYLVWRF